MHLDIFDKIEDCAMIPLEGKTPSIRTSGLSMWTACLCGRLAPPDRPPSDLQVCGGLPSEDVGDTMAILFPIALLSALLTGATCGAGAATLDLARRITDGAIIPGLRIEGEIVAGDAQSLLDAYARYGTMISPIYLRSRGGDVEEAMRMGAIIRRLRLATDIPLGDREKPPLSLIKVDRQEDNICASACFLVYAAGAKRAGSYLALHRPYLPRKEAQALSDVEYVEAQKKTALKVKTYLVDMEVDQYWIDRMFATNSQEGYVPTLAEADNKFRHLMGMVPSLKEVVLSKCKEDTEVDEKLNAYLANRNRPLTGADIEKYKEITRDQRVFWECSSAAFEKIQQDAFERENEPILKAKCLDSTPSRAPQNPFDAIGRNGQPLVDRRCRSEELLKLSLATIKRWHEEAQKSWPTPPVAYDFDAKGLSPSDMAKRGKDAYKAAKWGVASQWFRKAADLGNAEGMVGMSWIYGNGKGVPVDHAASLRWLMAAAEHGNTDAMESLADRYDKGEDGVPQNFVEALRWERKAVDSGSARAMFDVGMRYKTGRGVSQDDAEAVRWYRKAAAAGDGLAMYTIGAAYAYGVGVPKDEEQAREWMKKAILSSDDGGRNAATQWLLDDPAP